MALLSIPVCKLWALRPHTLHQAWHRRVLDSGRTVGGLKPRDPDSVGLGWDLGLWMLPIHAHGHMNTLTFLYRRTYAQVYTGNYTHTDAHTLHMCTPVPTFMQTRTHTSPTPRAVSMPCTAPHREPGVRKLSLSWRQSEHRQLGYQSRSCHPPIQEGRVGSCRGKSRI